MAQAQSRHILTDTSHLRVSAIGRTETVASIRNERLLTPWKQPVAEFGLK